MNKNFNILEESIQETGVVNSITFAAGASLALGIGSAIFGGIGQSKSDSAAKKQQKNANKAAKQQYKFDKREAERVNKYNKEGLKIDKQNYANQRDYQIQSMQQDRDRKQYLQDFNFRQQNRAYRRSEQNYAEQLSFNKRAVKRAITDVQRGVNEELTGQAFDKQDLNLRTMAGLGTAQLGQAGNSTLAALQSVNAARGRDIAVMNANLVSAVDQAGRDIGDFVLDYEAANAQANAQRLLRPERMADLPGIIAPPERVFQDPYEVRVGPEPIKGIYGGSGIWGTLATGASALAGINWGGINKPSGN